MTVLRLARSCRYGGEFALYFDVDVVVISADLKA